MVTLTSEEWAILNLDERKTHLKDEERTVFGADVKHKGKAPLEQGIGSPGRETGNHFAALRKREQMGIEPEGSYDQAVEDLWKTNPDHAKKLGLTRPKKVA